MDNETARLIVTGLIARAASLITLLGSLLTAWITTSAHNSNAEQQRIAEERKFNRQHAGDVFGSVHEALTAMKGFIQTEVYGAKDNDVETGRRLEEAVISSLSRLLFVADEHVTVPAMKAREACKNLYVIARAEIQEHRPEHEVVWGTLNKEYAERMRDFTREAAKTLEYKPI
ncbi:hypothetical protein [Arthrobacter sp. CJ23]|uniref:hypothetical protein n=1 Tax=Arthrobacter sp. CJ23 TaxID=2972479 RepID=UPI00215D267E|nr:hypothetical protein [Arthrobacter sp. CJ23]UVJ37990.1 hypothetical protein NVV90_12005 [Arthrobacter sp. CJ23]